MVNLSLGLSTDYVSVFLSVNANHLTKEIGPYGFSAYML